MSMRAGAGFSAKLSSLTPVEAESRSRDRAAGASAPPSFSQTHKAAEMNAVSMPGLIFMVAPELPVNHGHRRQQTDNGDARDTDDDKR